MTQPDPFVIRPAQPADAVTVSALTEAAYTKYIPVLGRKPQPMTADYAQIIAQHPVWMIERDGLAVGSLVLMAEPEVMLIYSIAVSPDYQRQGVGKRLLAWADQQAQQAGLARIRLYTNALMADNVAWYLRSGYAETSREAYLGGILVHMAKPLA